MRPLVVCRDGASTLADISMLVEFAASHRCGDSWLVDVVYTVWRLISSFQVALVLVCGVRDVSRRKYVDILSAPFLALSCAV